MRHYILTAMLMLAMLVPAQARDLTAEEKTGLEARIADFDKAMSTGDYAKTLDATPPRIYTSLAETAGVTVEQLREAVLEQIAQAFEVVEITGYSMDMDAAQYLATPDGTPYVIIPTVTEIAMPDERKMVADGYTLALIDDGRWYLLNVDEAPQIQIFRNAYPSFAEVELPQGKMEFVE